MLQRNSYLVKKNRKRTEAWRLKLLMQVRNEGEIFCGVVGNSGCRQGNG